MKNKSKFILILIFILLIIFSACEKNIKPENNDIFTSNDNKEDKNSTETKESIIEKYKLEGMGFKNNNTAIAKYPKTKEDEKFVVPDFIKEIGAEAFKENKYIKSVVLPEGLTKIDWSAFEGSSLEEINIPDSLSEIGDFAFLNCENLTKVYASEDIIEKILKGRFSFKNTAFAANYAEKKFIESGDRAKLDSYSIKIPYNYSISYKTNNSSNSVNGGMILDSGEYIYYAYKEGLFRTDKQGKNGELILKTSVYMLFEDNGEIYYHGKDVNSDLTGIFHIEKDSLETELILEGYTDSFVIADDTIIFTKYEDKTGLTLYSYNMSTKEICLIDKNLATKRDIDNLFIYDNKVIYVLNTNDYSGILMQYDISKNESYELQADYDRSNIIADFTSSNFQVYNDELYAKFDTGIYKSKIDKNLSWELIMPRLDDKGHIYSLHVTDNYIFFFTNYFLLDCDIHYFHVFRMKHDGTEIINIYDSAESRTDGGSTGIYVNMYIVEDKIFLVNFNMTKTVLDFDGNVLDWDI